MGVKDRSYYDWFGTGDTNQDVKSAIEEYGEPTKVFFEDNGYMAALVYEDKVVCVGYDGHEYKHTFIMELNQ